MELFSMRSARRAQTSGQSKSDTDNGSLSRFGASKSTFTYSFNTTAENPSGLRNEIDFLVGKDPKYAHLLKGTNAVLAQAKLTKDVVHPVTLRFRDKTIEEVFLNEHAVSHKRTVYVGYWILLVLGAIGIFACSLVLRVEKVSACTEIKKPSVETLCQKMLGNKFIGERQVEKLRNENTTLSIAIINDIIDTQNPNNVGWNIINFICADCMTTKSIARQDAQQILSQVFDLVWLAIMVLIGTAAHWRIHWTFDRTKYQLSSMTKRMGSRRRKRKKSEWSENFGKWLRANFKDVKNKKWATLFAFFVYTIGLIGFCGLSLMIHSYDAYWEMRLFIWYTFVLLIGTFFTGILFWNHLIMCGIASLAFYGCSIPIVLRNQTIIVTRLDSLEEMEPIFEVVLYSVVAALNALFTALMLISSYSNELTARRSFLQEFMIYYQQDKMLDEKNKRGNLQEQMLLKILPPKIVEQLTAGTSMHASVLRSLSSTHESVCILFADVVGFSSFAKQVDAVIVMQYLNRLFEVFDSLCDDFNVYKIETIGDCYVATVGLVTGRMIHGDIGGADDSTVNTNNSSAPTFTMEDVQGEVTRIDSQTSSESSKAAHHTNKEATLSAARQNTRDMVMFAKLMVRHSKTVAQDTCQGILTTRALRVSPSDHPDGGGGDCGHGDDCVQPTSLRVGVHTGSCVSGIIGTRNLRYCILGESVSIAAKLEQSGRPDMIHASATVREMAPKFHWKPALSSSSAGWFPWVSGTASSAGEGGTFLLNVTGESGSQPVQRSAESAFL